MSEKRTTGESEKGMTKTISKCLHHDAAPGVLLLIATVIALLSANFGQAWYSQLLNIKLTATVAGWGIDKPLLLWINDGLMAIFFLLVGLELKREVLFGSLGKISAITFPAIAALGGVAVPVLIYSIMNWGDPVAMKGWAVPAATDIAFALGILALLGSRVPVMLKVLLTTVAVVDDLVAIVIIALFYTDSISMMALNVAVAMIIGLFLLNKFKVTRLSPYLILGFILWLAVLKSGVHATIAAVVLAAFIPAGKKLGDPDCKMQGMEHKLHPWVIFAILPVFAFANAGIPLAGVSFSDLFHPIPLGIALGLFLGKQIGVFGFCRIAVALKLTKLPEGMNWKQVYGIAALCGVGFTMSLFIGSLAFDASSGDVVTHERLGILLGSLCSGVVGMLLIRSTMTSSK